MKKFIITISAVSVFVVLGLLLENGILSEKCFGLFFAVILISGILIHVCSGNKSLIALLFGIGISHENSAGEMQPKSARWLSAKYVTISFVTSLIPLLWTALVLLEMITLSSWNDGSNHFEFNGTALFGLVISSPFIIGMDVISVIFGKKALRAKKQIFANVSIFLA